MDRTRAVSFSMSWGATDLSTYTRSTEMQSWPELEKNARVATSATSSRSAPAATIMAFLPPSSAENPMSRSPHWRPSVRPVAVEPVNMR